MPKLIYPLGVIGALLLLSAAMYLAWLNRSPKIYSALLVPVAAIAATVFTFWTLLKPTTITERFPVSLVLDRTSALPILFDTGDGLKALERISMLSRAAYEQIDAPGNVFQRRTVHFANADEKQKFYVELLQLELMKQIYGNLSYDVGISAATSPNRPAIVQTQVFTLVRPKSSYRLPGSEIARALSKNQFLNQMERRFWDDARVSLPLPTGAKLSVPDPQSLVIERPEYFRLRIWVEPIGTGHGVPAHLAEKIRQPGAETASFLISMEANFERLTAENPDVEDVKEWAKSLFNGIKKQMADPGY